MSSTDTTFSRELAGRLFDETICQIASLRRDAGTQAYFPLEPEADAATYFSPLALGTMRAADFEFPGGGTAEGLVNALAAHWMAEGQRELAGTARQLKDLAEALAREAVDAAGEVSILCYTMF